MKGLGHAILSGRNLINDEVFGVLLADDLCFNHGNNSVFDQMVELYHQSRCSIVAVMEVPEDQVSKYGIISGTLISDDIYCIDSMVEKPLPKDAPSNLAVIGRYILTPSIFQILEQTQPGQSGEIQLTDAINQLAQDEKVLAYKFKGERFDCGSMEGFVKATNFYYQHYYS